MTAPAGSRATARNPTADAAAVIRHRETTGDGIELSLLHLLGETRWQTPVLLTHGTFSNARVCERLASFLTGHGFDCWIAELRGHGGSQRGRGDHDFEHLADYDVPAALDAVRRHTGQPQVFLVGHSGGGLVFLMHLARNPGRRAHVKGVVTLASQATEAGATIGARLTLVAFAALNNLLGYLPGPAFGLGPEREFRGVMNQWFRWNLGGRWVGRDGFDYGQALSACDVPTMMLAGAGDRLIAPLRGCRKLYDLVGSRDKRLVVCGKSTGFAEDYGHARIIASRAGQREVWPIVLRWLGERGMPR